jgi:import inner membrane translocase subunit TIM9
MEKYLKMNQRISQRFQEFQILANENAMALAQKSGSIPR